MHTKATHTKLITFLGIELFALFLILCGAAVQVLLGKEHMFFLLLRTIYAPLMVFLAGLYTSQGKKAVSFLYMHTGIYAILFLFFGLCNQVLINHKKPFQSLVRIITMIKMPTPSEMFFTSAVLFFCAAITAKYLDTIYKKKKLIIVLGILALFMSFFPSDIFGYPIIGVFTGCDTYDCIPLLPYLGYFIAGIFIEDLYTTFSKKILLSTALITGLSATLMATAFRPAAMVTVAAFPVYIIFLFSRHFSLYRTITTLLIHLYQRVIAILKKCYHDFSDNKKNALPLYFIVYTLFFSIMITCVLFSFIEYDNSIVWERDALSQYVPRVHYFIDYIHECISLILKGKFNLPSYSFRVGFGNATVMSYEPVYWLFALFNSSNVELAYNLLIVLRFFLVGLSSSILFLYFKKGYFETLIGSMMYTFCGFALYAGVLHAHFLAPMIFLPLLIIATEEIFRKKRWYLCTIFVAIALPSNYYFIYMSSIAMGIYYIGRFLFTKDSNKKNWKYFFMTTCTFASSYLLGVLIGNISLFTSFSSYLGSARSNHDTITSMSFFYYKKNWLARLYTYFISTPSSPGSWLKLGFIPLSYIAIVILLIKKGHKLLKFLFLTGLTFCIFPIAAYILGGFSMITNRWCYIFALLISYITVRFIPELRTLSRRELKILFISLLPYALIILVNRDFRNEYTLSSLAVLLCNYIIVLCMNQDIKIINKQTAQAAIVILCCSALTLNGYYQYLLGNPTSEDDFVKMGHVIDEITDTPMKVFDNYPDKSFYRVSTATIPRKNLCSSLVMNYNSLATFSSTVSGPIHDYNAEMGNTAWNLVQLEGFDNRTFMNELACVKYYSLAEDELSGVPYGYQEIGTKTEGNKKYHIFQNKFALPLGYTYDSVISEDELSEYDTLEKQEVMLQSAVLEDTGNTNLTTDKTDILSTSEEAKIIDYKADGLEIKGNTVKILKPDATLSLTFEGLDNSETYLVFDGVLNPTESNGSCVVDMFISYGDMTRKLSLRSTNYTYGTGQDMFLFNLGFREKAIGTCNITFKNTGTFTYDSLKVCSQPMKTYSSYVSKLTENVLENVKIDSNTITGDISVDKEKLLVLSIPYQKGWTAYVDGKEVDIKKANLMYSAISLEPGDHDIKLVFRRPGIKASLCLSAVGITIFIIALIIRRRRIRISK